MSPGYQAVQASHAIADFIFQYPEEARLWHDNSNYLIILTVPTEQDLRNLPKTLGLLGIRYTLFTEPDIDNAPTALALCPGPNVKKFCQGFPLALSDKRVSKDDKIAPVAQLQSG
jgi:peptidyl-tRNA hydrolase PTH2